MTQIAFVLAVLGLHDDAKTTTRDALGSPTESPSATPEYHTDPELVSQQAAKEESPLETGQQVVVKEVAEVPLARRVPHASEPDPESAPQALTLPQQSPARSFPCPDKIIYGQEAPSAIVYSIVRHLAAPLPPPEEPVLRLEVPFSAPATPPLASTTPQLGQVQAELARLKHKLRTCKSPGAQAIAREFDQPREGPTEGLLAPCQEWNQAKSEPSLNTGDFIRKRQPPHSECLSHVQADLELQPWTRKRGCRHPAPRRSGQKKRPFSLWGPKERGTTSFVSRHRGSGGGRMGGEIPRAAKPSS